MSSARASCRVHRGTLAPAGLPWTVPVFTIEHATPGPKAVICAGLHGDEAVGVGVVQQLLEELPRRLLRGSVRLFPSLNPGGLQQGCRALPDSSLDLNRAFPGDARGSGPQRLARAIWRDTLDFAPALVLDLHADSPACIPYAILDRLVTRSGKAARLQRELREHAQATGLTVIRDYAPGPYRRFELDRSLTGALLNHGAVPAVTLELGPRRYLDPDALEGGVVAVLGALDSLGLVSCPAPPHPSRVGGGPWRRDSGPDTSTTGLLRPLARPGQVLAPGADLAEVRRLDGALMERITVTRHAVVMSLAEHAWVPRGVHVATLAILDD